MRHRIALAAALVVASFAAAATAVTAATATSGPTLKFSLFVDSSLRLGQVLWTGTEFVYIVEHEGNAVGKLETSLADGSNLQPLASFEQGGEEMRCVPSPGRPYAPSGIYCHTADNRILLLSTDGTSTTLLARLPASAGSSDGAIAFDGVGKFGHRLLVASGGSNSNGGKIYTVGSSGTVRLVGTYPGPAGADNIMVAPRHFGRAAGAVLITIDQVGVSGRVLAMSNRGTVTVLASHLGNGVNSIQVIKPSPARRPPGSAAAGLYFSDRDSGNVYFAPAAPLKRYGGDVIVGGEQRAWFWILRPRRDGGYQVLRIRTNLPTNRWTIEGGAYVP